jgi:hypothetical protein
MERLLFLPAIGLISHSNAFTLSTREIPEACIS